MCCDLHLIPKISLLLKLDNNHEYLNSYYCYFGLTRQRLFCGQQQYYLGHTSILRVLTGLVLPFFLVKYFLLENLLLIRCMLLITIIVLHNFQFIFIKMAILGLYNPCLLKIHFSRVYFEFCFRMLLICLALSNKFKSYVFIGAGCIFYVYLILSKTLYIISSVS